MPKKTMTLTFGWDGSVKKETSGFTGKKCTERTKFIEEALGGKTTKRTFKPEYYATGDSEEKLTVNS